jgi:hypothetical protein
VKYARTVIGYHGCRRSVAKALLDGGPFKTSENDYDWLGRGIYFWEHGPDRALRWAKKYRHPAVVGAVIQLGKCFDLLDTRYTNDLGEFYPYLEHFVRQSLRVRTALSLSRPRACKAHPRRTANRIRRRKKRAACPFMMSMVTLDAAQMRDTEPAHFGSLAARYTLGR